MVPGFLKSIFRYRFLLGQLVARDFKVKYKRSVLGVLWSVLHPLIMMLIMTVVFQNLFKMTSSGSMNYPVYIISGLVMFNFFTEATNAAMVSITSNYGLVTKVCLPKAIFPVSKVLSSCVNLLFSLMALYAVILVTGEEITWHHILLIYDFFCLMCFSMGVGFFLAALTVFFQDMIYLYNLVTLAWMYMTPLFYDLSILSEDMVEYFKLNPMFKYIDYARTIILYHGTPDVNQSISIIIIGVVVLMAGFVFFKKNQNKFIYYI